MTSLAVGIDLGTTFSVVTVADMTSRAPEVLPDKHGFRLVPSVVYFESARSKTVGFEAKNSFISQEPSRSCAGFKRFMGRPYSEELAQEASAIGMTLVRGRNDRAELRVTGDDGLSLTVPPEELSAAVLTELLKIVEERYGVAVSDAVVTVPARFSVEQREATKQAAAIAGLTKVTIVNEPTAAALAYGLERPPDGKDESVVVVFDFGGGTFDVTVMRISSSQSMDNVFTVLSTDGDTMLGGMDIDKAIAAWAVQEFRKSTPALPNPIDARSMRRLLAQCEVAKRQLASAVSTKVFVESFHAGKKLELTLSRAKMDQLCQDLYKRVMSLVEQAVCASKQEKADVDKVVMVGGSSRVVKLQEMMRQMFEGTSAEILYTMNPDEAISMGAAHKALSLKQGVRRFQHNDVVSLSLGIKVKGELFAAIVAANETVPISKTKQFVTSSDDQTDVSIAVFEGEHKLVESNNKLGSFLVKGVPPRPAGDVCVAVTMTVSTEGVIHVSATCLQNGVSEAKTITCDDRVKLTEEEVENIKARAKRPRTAKREREYEEKIDELNALVALANQGCQSDKRARLILNRSMTIEDFCKQEKRWAKQQFSDMAADNITVEDIRSRISAVRTQCGRALGC